MVSHVESGACNACRGRENARQSVFNFVARNEASRGLLSQQAIAYHDGTTNTNVRPTYPYKCQHCPRQFKLLSSMMNHVSDIHQNEDPRRMRTAARSITYDNVGGMSWQQF